MCNAGIATTRRLPIVAETTYCQVQMQDKGKAKYSGSWSCAHQLYREGGVKSIYKGTASTLITGEK